MWQQMAWVWTLAVLFPGSVVLDKLLNLSMPQLLHLKIGDNNLITPWGKKLTYEEYLEPGLVHSKHCICYLFNI